MRNIVLITLDSLRADHCSFMGYKRETTPAIDKMAINGLFFENAIASGVPTAPSLVGVFTGDYTLNDSLSGGIKDSDKWRREIFSRKTLAHVLSKKGYNTAAFHANPWASRLYGFNKGFNYYQDFLIKNSDTTARKKFNSPPVLKKLYQDIQVIVKKESTLTDWKKIYPFIIDWIDKAKKPYFLWILLLDTHLPYIPPKEYRIFSNKSTFYLLYLNWELRRKWRLGKDTSDLLKQVQKNHLKIKPKKKREIINAYDDSIYYADKFIDKLWSDLKQDNPLFIISADHGEGFGEHEFYYHQPILYEEFIHVPLIIYNAGMKGKIEYPVSLCGLSPTILDLIGEENEFPSESFLHEGKDWVISKVFERNRRKIAIRTKDWKFITGQKDEDELYDLKQDSHEQENLIDRHSELREEIQYIVKNHVKHEMEMRRIRDRTLKIKRKRN